jgi:hypothetical protein
MKWKDLKGSGVGLIVCYFPAFDLEEARRKLKISG